MYTSVQPCPAPMESKADLNSLTMACWGPEVPSAQVALLCTRVTESCASLMGIEATSDQLEQLNNEFYSVLLRFFEPAQGPGPPVRPPVPDCNLAAAASADWTSEATSKAIDPAAVLEHAICILCEHMPCVSMTQNLCHRIMLGLGELYGISEPDMVRARNLLVKQGRLVYSGRIQRKVVTVMRAFEDMQMRPAVL